MAHPVCVVCCAGLMFNHKEQSLRGTLYFFITVVSLAGDECLPLCHQVACSAISEKMQVIVKKE